MIRLEKSETLQRKIRQDDVPELAISTWDLVREAIQAGRPDEALEFMDYELTLDKVAHDLLTTINERFVTHLAGFGEEELEKVWRQIYSAHRAGWMSTRPGAVELLQRFTEDHRGIHRSDFTIVEEPDRYVVKLDPCGTGGRLRRTRGVGMTKKAYDWSWGKSGVAYYCTHCCLGWEIIPIEVCGYPTCIVQYADNPEDPCLRFFYKKPELIPEEFFTRIGKAKTIK